MRDIVGEELDGMTGRGIGDDDYIVSSVVDTVT